MKLTWTKTESGWFGIHGKYRAEVRKPHEGSFIYHWTVRAGAKEGSGGTTSPLASKRAAENEVDRMIATRTQRAAS